jgi:tetratricopeptide (TPR) repeat protein
MIPTRVGRRSISRVRRPQQVHLQIARSTSRTRPIRQADTAMRFRLCLKVYLANTSTPSMAKMALLFLADAYERSGQTDFLTYLTSNVAAKASTIPDLALVERELQAHWLVKGGRYSDAIAIYKGITTDFSTNSDASKFALFNMGETYNFYLNDAIHAKTALQEFKSKYPSDRLAACRRFHLVRLSGGASSIEAECWWIQWLTECNPSGLCPRVELIPTRSILQRRSAIRFLKPGRSPS